MKILLVSHDFLPEHAMGTEIYTWHLGSALRGRGHDVHIFTTEKDISLPNLSVQLRHYDGLPVHELINNLFYNDFRETWDYPQAAQTFGIFLDDLKPDAVHFMHLLFLSVACVEEVHRRGIPIFYTLHDYWLQCARWGQRKHREGSICHTIDFDRCGDCMESFKFGQTRLERATAKGLARLRSGTGIDLRNAARGAAALWKSGPKNLDWDPEAVSLEPSGEEISRTPAAQARAAEIRERDQALRERLLPLVERFLAPSRFLRDRFLEWGIPADQIDYLRTGINLEPFEGFERGPRGERVRIAFVGTVAPHKGTHLVLEAWLKLAPELREKGELAIYGPTTHYPGYKRFCQGLAERCGISLAGRVERSDMARTLGSIDLLVIPSIWYENSPLIILEALATRTPLLVADLGGMAELVDVGVSGYHFGVGSAESLAEKLTMVLSDPSCLEKLYSGALRVQSITQDAEICEGHYEKAVAKAQKPSA